MKGYILRFRASQLNTWLLALLAFAIPLSTSVISLLAVLIVLFWLLEGNFADKLVEIFTNPVVIAVLVFLLILVAGLLWSPDVEAGLGVLRDRWKIALLPVFLTTIRYEHRSVYVQAFVLGLLVAMGITYLAWFGCIHYADVSPLHLTHKTFHVVYNPLLAFAIYLVLHSAIWGEQHRGKRFILFLLAAVMSCNMFITEGRTGQVAFFVLLALLLFQLFGAQRGKALIVTCLVLPIIFVAGYCFSPVFQQRVDLARQEIGDFKKNPDTSVGMRLLYWQNSLEIFRQYPLLGTGTGGFDAAYAQVNQKKSPLSFTTDNPHNQYVLVATMVGIPGILSLLYIFVAMFCLASGRQADNWQRIRVAFPLFFLTIMMIESYLKVYETAFFFALFTAVFYKKKADARRTLLHREKKTCWLILSYRAQIEGSACSQHIDDRLPFFRRQGVEPVLLTGPVGIPSITWVHYKTHSLAPSGIRFELRHFLRKRLQRRWQFKTVETVLLLPVFPLYLIEKLLINMESEWSWFFLASVRGVILCWLYKPDVIYSTGGSASAHVAGLLINRWTGIKWLAETQDPLVHDHNWQRSQLVLRIYKLLEKQICKRADHFIFLVRAAAEHAAERMQGTFRGTVIYPGSVPQFFQQGVYEQTDCFRFAHFGSLAGTRNMIIFFQALQQVLAENQSLSLWVRVDIYGSFDRASEQAMEQLHLQSLVTCHGSVARKEALVAMQKADCLLLIQNLLYFSCETIPSKVYEYLLSGRPILGLLHRNDELKSILVTDDHYITEADDVGGVAKALHKILARYQHHGLPTRTTQQMWTVETAVNTLIQLGATTRVR